MTDTAALTASLDEWAEGDLDDEAEQLTEDAAATLDPDVVNRMLRRMRRLEDEAANVTNLASAEFQRIVTWRTDRLATIKRQADSLAVVLDGWARANYQRTKACTVSLPNGDLKLRPPSPSFVCDDPHGLWAWCSDSGEREDWVSERPVYTPDASRLRLLLKPGAAVGEADLETGLVSYEAHDPATGEVVPHVVIRQLPDRKFTYKTRSGS